MKFVLFVWAIIYYSSSFTNVKAGKKDKYVEECKANFFDQFIAPKTEGCPCWPSYLQDVICTCSQAASGPFESGSDHDITCKIAPDTKHFGVNLLACGGGFKNYISPYFEPLFMFEKFGKTPFGICLNAPAGLADVITLIIRVINELKDLFDEICDFDENGKDEYRRRLLIDETQQAFKYMEELMQWRPTSVFGQEAEQQRDELAAMIFKPGGLADIAMQMIGMAEIKEIREEARRYHRGHGKGHGHIPQNGGGRRLLGKKGSGCDKGDCGHRHYEDGPDICPYRFLKFLNYKTRGKYDPDQNPFEYILEELECAVDDVDCDNIYNFQKYPVPCSIKRALDNPIRDECDKKKDGKDCDCEKDDYGKGYKNPLTEYFKSLPEIRLFITAFGQTKSCEKGLVKAATLLDEGITRGPGIYGGRRINGITGEVAPGVSDAAGEEVAADPDVDADADAPVVVKKKIPSIYGGCKGPPACALSSKGCKPYRHGGK